MSRKTELATIFRELNALMHRMMLVGAFEARLELTKARDVIYAKYRKEVERIAREAAG